MVCACKCNCIEVISRQNYTKMPDIIWISTVNSVGVDDIPCTYIYVLLYMHVVLGKFSGLAKVFLWSYFHFVAWAIIRVAYFFFSASLIAFSLKLTFSVQLTRSSSEATISSQGTCIYVHHTVHMCVHMCAITLCMAVHFDPFTYYIATIIYSRKYWRSFSLAVQQSIYIGGFKYNGHFLTH